jgi:hypothetical protein
MDDLLMLAIIVVLMLGTLGLTQLVDRLMVEEKQK